MVVPLNSCDIRGCSKDRDIRLVTKAGWAAWLGFRACSTTDFKIVEQLASGCSLLLQRWDVGREKRYVGSGVSRWKEVGIVDKKAKPIRDIIAIIFNSILLCRGLDGAFSGIVRDSVEGRRRDGRTR